MTARSKIAKTQQCQKYGHREFALVYNPEGVPSCDIDWFVEYFHEQVAAGVKFLPQQTVQIGWMVTRVEELGDDLTLEEPDMHSIPIQFVRSVTQTLRHLRQHRDALASVGLEEQMTMPTILQSAIACSKYQDIGDFMMHRTSPKGPDSGWFFGCLDETHDHNNPANLLKVLLLQLVSERPEIIPFLAFPEKSRILWRNGDPEIWHCDEPLRIRSGSYLAKKYGL